MLTLPLELNNILKWLVDNQTITDLISTKEIVILEAFLTYVTTLYIN